MDRLEIRTEVEGIVQDGSYSIETINGYIDQTIIYAGAQVDLPDLKRIDTVNTALSVAYTTLSGLTGGFSGKLRSVRDADGNPMTVYSKLDLLMDEYPTMVEVGEVEAVALEGSILWYQKIPATVETLTCLYYRNPTILADDNASPNDFPAHLHRSLFVHGTAWMIYDQIEDDVEEKKVNAESQFWHSFNERNGHSGIVKLREWLAKTRTHNISSCWRQ